VTWTIDGPEGNESGKIRFETVRYTRGQGLDLGCGANKLWPHAIGVDNYTDTALFGVQMKPDVVANVSDLKVFGSASMDWVYSSHVLEHVEFEKVQKTLTEWWRVLKPSGHLLMYLPDEDEYPKVGEKGANPDHKWNISADRVTDLMKAVGGWDLVRCDKRSADNEYSLYFVFKKRGDGKHLLSHKDAQPAKRAAVCRYGAAGDALQASSILPGLKEQGYHITFYCNPRTLEVLRHDPHIDDFYLQDTDQVPNQMLPEFWAHEAKKYEKFINLSESVEGPWLALPGRTNHSWPLAVRQKYLDVNYMEFQHDLAGVPMPPQPKFYATDDEKAWAKKESARIGGDMLVMYALAGSSVHKVWPQQDQLFARILLKYKQARIVTVGDEGSSMLEIGWENEPRVAKMAGKYTFRQSMSLLDECDMVIGPETGMLNAAAHMSMPKIVFLSHSSANNLTKHWLNTQALEPVNTPCWPCHMMHYSFDNCRKDFATGVALCASNISCDQAWEAFEKAAPTDVAKARIVPILEAA
jgi:ADP-heptose:LPS heptosyltransferase/predicted SAM-dependent methyltransferase